ncbi:MAG: ABC transporter ATP-binding protein [Cyanobacteriota bacterium]|nr:ABC transporter ATP-binding protein [Cyanobacteriota bacterium]
MTSPSPLGQAQPTPAIELQQVCKRFGSRSVVCDLSLRIPAGEMFGLLGPNGAGKSTTIRMLTTLTSPSQGQIRIQGLDVVKQSLLVRQVIGVVLQQVTLDNDLSVWENLEFHGRMHHMPRPQRQEAIQQWLDYVRLSDRQESRVKTLSGGMKRRLQIARALLHRPQVLFLDEPTVGLDPQARRLLWEIISDLNQQGMTILLTTHYMEEAEALCHRLGIMDGGQLIELGSPEQLRHKFGEALLVKPSRASQNGSEPADPGALTYEFFADLRQAQHYLESQPDKTGMMVRPSNLEDIFVKLTGRRLD